MSASWRHSFSVVISLVLMLGLLSQMGCSVVMAAKQPPKRNLGILKPGTSRGLVLAELGQPMATETRDSHKVDVFAFTQGYSKPAKAGRTVFHGVADVLTLGLWEVVGTPTEAVFDGQRMSLEVTYDEHEKVIKVIDLQRQEAARQATVRAAEGTR